MLAAIERELGTEDFLVIGVHSPKFPGQRDPEMVRASLGRLGVTHPVVHDPDSEITQRFGVRGWPTMILVDPNGYLLGTIRGEPEPQALLLALRDVLDRARRQGMLTGGPLPRRPEPAARRRLAYPGALEAGGTLLSVADTGHHQVLICSPSGAESFRVGAGRPGFCDRAGTEAELRGPYGTALAGTTLYVADTANHAIRAVDLASGEVTTVAGARPPGDQGPEGEQALRSPWGLAWDGRRLFIAAAGLHQIWVFNPATGRTGVFAGTGVEGNRDGAASEAWFAQPSGLALCGGLLYVVDSETSSIRALSDLDRRPWVRTVCGAGDLFGFGDRDGAGPAAELQHPIGIAAGDGMLYVADSFNHKIRALDPARGSCRTLFGGGEPEIDAESPEGTRLAAARPGMPAFCEPEAVSCHAGELLVADTGNHRILTVRIADGDRRVLIGG